MPNVLSDLGTLPITFFPPSSLYFFAISKQIPLSGRSSNSTPESTKL
ncbi:MAG: hypothetical protein ABIG37_02645 [Nanoarchaeota archaeon]